MERLLAYEGPVVHVDHSHRAPAPTSLSNREEVEALKGVEASKEALEKEKRECNKHINELHDYYKGQSSWKDKRIAELQAQVVAKDNELVKSRNSKKRSVRELMDQTIANEAKIAELNQLVKSMEAENEGLREQQLSEHDKLRQFRDDLKQARNDVENARASETRMKSAIRQLEERNDVLKSQNATLIDSWNQLEKEKKALEAKLAGL